ncbi:hypothetical protein Cs308_0577 [Candidatus Chlamydia sanziniae]|uniref:Uncharacterized protein n=1 Tax=Candidatus Chlamydia sanziniae TaxID=1806891 RepID=A0A1A9HVM1_9CHLA|nr:hypothetical protein Cs308_0577 [Candidatus Chlamydia sanziniae]
MLQINQKEINRVNSLELSTLKVHAKKVLYEVFFSCKA